MYSWSMPQQAPKHQQLQDLSNVAVPQETVFQPQAWFINFAALARSFIKIPSTVQLGTACLPNWGWFSHLPKPACGLHHCLDHPWFGEYQMKSITPPTYRLHNFRCTKTPPRRWSRQMFALFCGTWLLFLRNWRMGRHPSTYWQPSHSAC